MCTERTFKGIDDLLKQLPDEKTAAKYWASLRWENGEPIFPYCFSNSICHFSDGIRYKCKEKECKEIFSVRVGTVMEDSKVPIRKWLLAIYLLTESKKGISSIQLAEMIGVTQKTSWFMTHRIRETMKEKSPEILSEIVECDSTFVGGKMKNMHQRKRNELPNKGGFTHMTSVFGMIQRGGKVMTKIVKNESIECVMPIICERVVPNSYIVTDGSLAYKYVSKNEYSHRIVDHGKGEYVRGCWDSNSIESFWATVKRGYVGIYHYWSKQHLHRYMNEYTFRHNLREAGKNAKFNAVIKQSEGQLTWKQLVA